MERCRSIESHSPRKTCWQWLAQSWCCPGWASRWKRLACWAPMLTSSPSFLLVLVVGEKHILCWKHPRFLIQDDVVVSLFQEQTSPVWGLSVVESIDVVHSSGRTDKKTLVAGVSPIKTLSKEGMLRKPGIVATKPCWSARLLYNSVVVISHQTCWFAPRYIWVSWSGFLLSTLPNGPENNCWASKPKSVKVMLRSANGVGFLATTLLSAIMLSHCTRLLRTHGVDCLLKQMATTQNLVVKPHLLFNKMLNWWNKNQSKTCWIQRCKNPCCLRHHVVRNHENLHVDQACWKFTISDTKKMLLKYSVLKSIMAQRAALDVCKVCAGCIYCLLKQFCETVCVLLHQKLECG